MRRLPGAIQLGACTRTASSALSATTTSPGRYSLPSASIVTRRLVPAATTTWPASSASRSASKLTAPGSSLPR